ncbi:hypothetical protein J3E68DRAFT_99314 [Trichoderma sp. SZMC 28012]
MKTWWKDEGLATGRERVTPGPDSLIFSSSLGWFVYGMGMGFVLLYFSFVSYIFALGKGEEGCNAVVMVGFLLALVRGTIRNMREKPYTNGR